MHKSNGWRTQSWKLISVQEIAWMHHKQWNLLFIHTSYCKVTKKCFIVRTQTSMKWFCLVFAKSLEKNALIPIFHSNCRLELASTEAVLWLIQQCYQPEFLKIEMVLSLVFLQMGNVYSKTTKAWCSNHLHIKPVNSDLLRWWVGMYLF